MAKPRKNTQVVYRHLGKEKANGIAYIGENKIEIDARLSGKKHTEILLHEWTHLQHPEWSETKVIKYSKKLNSFLWDNNIRWVDLK